MLHQYIIIFKFKYKDKVISSMKVFLAEDSFALSKALITFFKHKLYIVTHYDDGEEAFDNINLSNLHDIYVIDINLPNISGLELVKQIRKVNSEVPIIVITASVDIINLEDAYDFGCSEYIKKPFNLKELNIRLEKLINGNNDKIITLKNDIKFNLSSSTLSINENIIDLRKKELRFLALLFKNHKQIITTQSIEEYVWEGEIKEIYPLRQLLSGLRKKIPYDFIKTEIGIGYSIYENYK
jgi:DNA-binding response OmpR family regulator